MDDGEGEQEPGGFFVEEVEVAESVESYAGQHLVEQED